MHRLSRKLWWLTVSLSVPNLVFATMLVVATRRFWAWFSCGSLSLLVIYDTIAFAVMWGCIDRSKFRAIDGTQSHHHVRTGAVGLTGRLCRAYFCATVLVWVYLVSVRSP
jgi:hypothetical protein